MLYFVRNIVVIFFSTNLFCQIKCHLISHIVQCAISVTKVNGFDFCVEFSKSLCNSIGSVCFNFCFFGSNFCCESICKSFNAFFDNCIGIFNNIGNNNGFNFGNVAIGFNRDNRISTALFELDKLHTNEDRDNNNQNESDENDQRNTDCGTPERNVEIRSKHEGNFACRNIAFNNIVGFVFAQGYSVGFVCNSLGTVFTVINVKIFNSQRQAILNCDKIGGYRDVNVELFACCSTGDGERVTLICLQTTNCILCIFGGNAQCYGNRIGNAVCTNDKDCTVIGFNNLIVANNVHGCFECGCIEFVVIKCRDGCFYGVSTGSRGDFSATVVGVCNSNKNLLRKLYAVCTFNNQLILVANIGCEQFAIIQEITTVENNGVSFLCNGDVLSSTNTVVDYVERVGSSCNQSIVACVNSTCEVFDREFYSSACVSTDCLNAGEIITIGERSDAFPSNGLDYNGSYCYVNLERSYGVVSIVQSYINVSGCNVCANCACAEGYGVIGSVSSNGIVTDNAVQCRKSNCNVCVNIACGIVNNGYCSIICPCKLCGLDFCRNNNLATFIGDGDAGSSFYVSRVEYCCCSYFAVYFNGACYVCVTVVRFYPVTVLQCNIGALKGNRLYCVCVDRNDHAANHNREHCYKSHDAEEIALACKLNLLMFHNITTFP